MDAKLLAKVPKAAKEVVRDADKAGAIDSGEFTMGDARRAVCTRLGLPEDALDDDKKGKGAVKKAISAALEALEGDNGDESDDGQVSPPPNRKAPAKAVNQSKPSSKPKTKGKAKSAEVVDEDGLEEEKAEGSNSAANAPHPPSPTLSESMSSVYDEPPPKRRTKGKRASKSAKDSEESPMSSMDDEPPAKRRASTEKKGRATKAKKDPNEGLSPEEARVADLKRIVVACGVRKQWSKEFADCPTPKEQTSRLLAMLKDLGMKGTPTLGKAKALKEKRELAQELDDVQEFEAARGLSTEPSRPRRRKAAARDLNDGPAEAPDGAMAAVLDFLGDDSDSD